MNIWQWNATPMIAVSARSLHSRLKRSAVGGTFCHPSGRRRAHDLLRGRGKEAIINPPFLMSYRIQGAFEMSHASARAVPAAPAGPELGPIAAGLPCRDGGRRVLEASYPGEPESVRKMRHQVTEALAGIPCAEDAIYALNEVATNAVVHSRSGQDDGEFAVAVDVFPGSQ